MRCSLRCIHSFHRHNFRKNNPNRLRLRLRLPTPPYKPKNNRLRRRRKRNIQQPTFPLTAPLVSVLVPIPPITLSPAFVPRTLVEISISESVHSEPMHSIPEILPGVPISVGEMVASVAMFNTALVLSKIVTPVIEAKKTDAVALSVVPVPSVCVAGAEPVDAETVTATLPELSSVLTPFYPTLDTVPIVFPINPSALVPSHSPGEVENSTPTELPVPEFSLVMIAVGADHHTLVLTDLLGNVLLRSRITDEPLHWLSLLLAKKVGAFSQCPRYEEHAGEDEDGQGGGIDGVGEDEEE